MCCEDNGNFGQIFLELDLIGVMFDLKQKIEPEEWLNNYTEITSMYCYVFNAFTWDFSGMGMAN
jgi:hypothetical protein